MISAPPSTVLLGTRRQPASLAASYCAFFFLILNGTTTAFAVDPHYIVVAQDGTGDFKTVTQAIDALPMFNYERVEIYIKNGVYDEKIRITQDYVTLHGQSKDSTIIEYNQLRSDWVARKDPIGPAVINIHADDVVLEDLTIRNTQPEIGPHAFAVYGTGTRTIIFNCRVLSKGGDTVSLWNYKTGMYYHSKCDFSGAVDCVCPRGWCFISDSKFYEMKRGSTVLWHAGGYDRNQKFVVENSWFDGVSGFELGRHHYEAQFYLLNCRFSSNLADTPIYRVTYNDPSKDRPFNWGERDYYFNCHRDAGDYKWFADNLGTANGSPKPSEITASWTFDHEWNPESMEGPRVAQFTIRGHSVLLSFSEPITVVGKPIIETEDGKTLVYESGAGSDTLRFDSSGILTATDLRGLSLGRSGKLLGTVASVHQRNANLEIGAKVE